MIELIETHCVFPLYHLRAAKVMLFPTSAVRVTSRPEKNSALKLLLKTVMSTSSTWTVSCSRVLKFHRKAFLLWTKFFY